MSIADVLPAFNELCRRHPFLVVEGAGGLAVPIDGRETMRDLASALQLPVLIVARPGLGTINHTALTVEYARAGGLSVVGVVISNYPDDARSRGADQSRSHRGADGRSRTRPVSA